MFAGSTVFSQLLDYLPRRAFHECVRRYDGDHRLRAFSCRDHFLTLAFAQLTDRESLRDIETCLRALGPKLDHAGFRSRIARSTLADASIAHDWRIFADFAHVLIAQARELYANEPFGVMLDETVSALDSTTIDLCLTLFPWAKFRRRKAAIKMHTLLDLRGNIPCFIHVSQGKTHDVTILDTLPIEPGAFYVMDRGYLDFARLYRFTRAPRSSSSAANATSRRDARPDESSTNARGCAATRPSDSTARRARSRIRTVCVGSSFTTTNTTVASCS